jgi:hypothetical protein
VRCDINNDVIESNENNNIDVMNFTVVNCDAPQADLNQDCFVNNLDLFEIAKQWLSNTTINNGLIGYWPFDIVPGQNTTDPNFIGWNTCVDVSDNHNDGFVQGALYEAGAKGTALRFDGIDDFVEIPTTNTLDSTTNTISLSAWIYLQGNVIANEAEIVSKHVSYGKSWRFKMHGNGNQRSNGNELAFADSNNVSYAYTCTNETNIDPNQWQHVIVMDEQGVVDTYLNGELINTCNNGYGIPPSLNASIFVGSFKGTSKFFTGMIDELRIYDRILTESEIQYLSNGLSADYTDNDFVNLSDISIISTEWLTDGLAVP